MNGNKFWAAVKKTVAVVIVTFIVTLNLVPGAEAANKYKTLHKFKGGKDGASPYARLVLDTAGNLYGTTYAGGAFDKGTVFKLTPNPNGTWNKKLLHHFPGGKDGAYPLGGLTFDQAGNLYGTATQGGDLGNCNSSGCGVVYELTPKADGSWKERVLHTFSLVGAGVFPSSSLIFDEAGNLYGTTGGGSYDYGTAFRLDAAGNLTVLHSFCSVYPFCSDGAYPSNLVRDSAGNLYGTTSSGGPYSLGTVFKLDSAGAWTDLYNFNDNYSGGEGYFPQGGVLRDAAGNLYGMTLHDSDDWAGMVFELDTNGGMNWIHNFVWGSIDGMYPVAGLAFDSTGNLYGTTPHGGAYGYGVVFKLTLGLDGQWSERLLHTFANHPGANPQAGLVLDSAGHLYGTTAGDGTTTFGSVFEITP